jgi:16S rRNA A1518/A1519 N6-dimethyltransferase RsmA/KsgA/DIM1 with predicted DNA glycosylase/AP lyase activity
VLHITRYNRAITNRTYFNFFSLATFYYFNQKRKIGREARKDRLGKKLEELLTAVRKVKTKKADPEDDNITG